MSDGWIIPPHSHPSETPSRAAPSVVHSAVNHATKLSVRGLEPSLSSSRLLSLSLCLLLCVSISFTYSLHWQLSLNPVNFLLPHVLLFFNSRSLFLIRLLTSWLYSSRRTCFPLKPLSRTILRVCPLYLSVPFVPLPSVLRERWRGVWQGCCRSVVPGAAVTDTHADCKKGMPSINLNLSRPTAPTGKRNHECDLFNSSIVSPRSVVLKLLDSKAPCCPT